MKKYKSREKSSIEDILKRLKDYNLKITPQRVAILKVVLNFPNHPSAEEIYNKIKKTYPNISFDTVYRTLLTFTEIGILDIVEGSGDVRRFDPNDKPHHHFRCRRCGKIEDFYYENYNEIAIPEFISKKFTINKVRVVLDGICDKCNISYSSSNCESNP